MSILGLIPARSGSKGIPGKNTIALAGKPLIAHTCKAATQSNLERTILSTDSQEIASVGEEYGVECPFLRPAEYAEDDTPMIDVMLHVLDNLQETEGYTPDALCLLQPTSPLRSSKHIDEAIDLFESARADTLVSVVEVPHQFRPQSLMEEKNGMLTALSNETVLRRQDKEVLFARNGPAILIVKTDFLQQEKTFYGSNCIGYQMDALSSVDIDTVEDLAYAEWLLSR